MDLTFMLVLRTVETKGMLSRPLCRGGVTLIIALNVSAHAGAAPNRTAIDCVVNEAGSLLIGTAQSWSFGDTWRFGELGAFERLTPGDLLPAAYLEKLRDAGWALQLDIDFNYHFKGGVYSVLVSGNGPGGTRTSPIMFSLFQGKNPDSAVIEGLVLQDPLGSLQGGLHDSQVAKGLPSDVSRYVQGRVYEFLRSGGFKTIEVDHSQNYLVNLLYRRRGRAKPATERALRFHEFLDDTYRFATTQFPAEF